MRRNQRRGTGIGEEKENRGEKEEDETKRRRKRNPTLITKCSSHETCELGVLAVNGGRNPSMFANVIQCNLIGFA